jgi:hypothetical protein
MTYLSSTFPIWLLPFVERLAPGILYAPLEAPGWWGDSMGIDDRLRLLAGLLVAVALIWMWGRWSPPPEGAFGKLRGASQRTTAQSSTHRRPGFPKTTSGR